MPRRYFDLETSGIGKVFESRTHEGQPIRLNLPKVALEKLFSAMYPMYVVLYFGLLELRLNTTHASSTRVPVTFLFRDKWESALELSTAWHLNTMRTVAMDTLLKNHLEPATKALMGQRYHIYQWILDGYVELVQRPNPISEEEGKILGGAIVSRICRLREHRIQKDSQWNLRTKKTSQARICKPSRTGGTRLLC